MSLMGVDVGTTGAKAVVFALDGAVLAQAYREYPLYHPQPGWSELNPNEVMEAVKEVIASAAQQASDPVRAIGISCQGEAVTPLDAQGNVIFNSPISFDLRSVPQARYLEEKLGKRRIFDITGHSVSSIYTMCKLMWLRENEPEVWNRARKFYCYEEMVMHVLGVEPRIDYSLAARTLGFDVIKLRWSREMLGAAEVPVENLPPVAAPGIDCGKVAARVADELGLRRDVVVATGAHDQPATALGAGVIEPNIGVDGTGTVECFTVAFAEPVLTDRMLECQFPCYNHALPQMYCTLAWNFTGGILLRWFRDNFADEEKRIAAEQGRDVYDVMLERATPGPVDCLVLPHFTMTGTPLFDNQARGAIVGLTLDHTKADLLKAVLDGITFELKYNLALLEQAGVPVQRLRATGGGAKSPLWLQLKADIFNKPIEVPTSSEGSCLGAAICAGVACGEYRNHREGVQACIDIHAAYEPRADMAAAYEEKFALYRQIYPALKDLHHAM